MFPVFMAQRPFFTIPSMRVRLWDTFSSGCLFIGNQRVIFLTNNVVGIGNVSFWVDELLRKTLRCN